MAQPSFYYFKANIRSIKLIDALEGWEDTEDKLKKFFDGERHVSND